MLNFEEAISGLFDLFKAYIVILGVILLVGTIIALWAFGNRLRVKNGKAGRAIGVILQVLAIAVGIALFAYYANNIPYDPDCYGAPSRYC